MKTCRICKAEKSIDEFYADSRYKGGHTPECVSCRREQRRQQHKKNKERENLQIRIYDLSHPEEKRIRNKKHYENNKEKALNYSYVYNRDRAYGITQETYDTMFNKQEGVCAICGLKETAVGRVYKRLHPLSVDHDHETRKVRGLLCRKCNRGLGCFVDNKELLIKAVSYLETVR